MISDTQHIWNSFSTHVYNFVKTKVSRKEDAEDILQDIFIKIHLNLDKLQSATKLQSWVFQITRNVINDYYRHTRLDTDELSQDVYIDENEGNYLDSLVSCLEPFIHKLPETYKDVIMLSEVEGLKHKEVAERLNISTEAAKSRVKRGRQILKTQFADHCHFVIDENGKLIGEHLCDVDSEGKHSCGDC